MKSKVAIVRALLEREVDFNKYFADSKTNANQAEQLETTPVQEALYQYLVPSGAPFTEEGDLLASCKTIRLRYLQQQHQASMNSQNKSTNQKVQSISSESDKNQVEFEKQKKKYNYRQDLYTVKNSEELQQDYEDFFDSPAQQQPSKPPSKEGMDKNEEFFEIEQTKSAEIRPNVHNGGHEEPVHETGDDGESKVTYFFDWIIYTK